MPGKHTAMPPLFEASSHTTGSEPTHTASVKGIHPAGVAGVHVAGYTADHVAGYTADHVAGVAGVAGVALRSDATAIRVARRARARLYKRLMAPMLYAALVVATAVTNTASANPFHTTLVDSVPNSAEPDRFTLMVWMADYDTRLSKFIRNKAVRKRVLDAVLRESRKQQLPVAIVLSVMHIESTFRPYAVSRVNAQGLMQVMPFWLEVFEEPDDVRLFDIDHNVRIGCRILRKFLDREKGNWYRALLRYNGSLGSNGRYYRKVIKAAHGHWLEH